MKRLLIIIAILSLSFTLMSQSFDDHLRLGRAYASSQQFDNAIAHYGKAIQLDPIQAEAYLVRGKLYCQIGAFDKCVEDLRQAERLDPGLILKERKEKATALPENREVAPPVL